MDNQGRRTLHVQTKKGGGVDEIRTEHYTHEYKDKKKYIFVAIIVAIIAILALGGLLVWIINPS